MSLLVIRNIIMYSVVSAILVVASFGIYNTLSTIVMEKTRDIAIMKSMGFHARDLRAIFLLEGLIVGTIGSLFGLALGVGLMKALSEVSLKPPGATEIDQPAGVVGRRTVRDGRRVRDGVLPPRGVPPGTARGKRASRRYPARHDVSAVLRAENLVRRLEGEVPVTLVDDVSLEIERGQFIAIMGPSGSGKSSLLYLLGLLDVPDAGPRVLDGEDTKAYGEDELANRRLKKLGFVFQFHFLLAEFTVLDNVTLPMRRLGELDDAAANARGMEGARALGVADQARQAPAPALRRPTPARGHRTLARQRPAHHPRRRTDRQPRFGVERQRAADPAEPRP